MVSIFLREQKRYSKKSLVKLFGCSEEKIVIILKKLKECGILKTVNSTDKQNNLFELLEDDVVIADINNWKNEYFYVFVYVGVIITHGMVLKCYPKYISDIGNITNDLKIVLKVIDKYGSKEQTIKKNSDVCESNNFNMLSLIFYLINDYNENGLYSNTRDIFQLNGTGEIVWDKTINETFTIISKNRPYYPMLYTKKRINDDSDYFKRLHECLLTICSKEMEDADLTELFDITHIEISDEIIGHFGEKEYILDRIQKEMNTQFNTRKQLVLKALYAYINQYSSLGNVDCFSVYGTNNFNLVWEDVCSDIMDNQLKKPLGALNLPIKLCDSYDKESLLISLIEKPTWHGYDKNYKNFKKIADDSLIPDLVSIVKNCDEYAFVIFDAKYYNIQLENNKSLKGQPGIEAITKQYLYQLSFRKFVLDHEIKKMKNCFLIPVTGGFIIEKGYVEMEMLNNLGLEAIEIRLLPTSMMYDYYLKNKKIDIDLLRL